MYRYRLGAEEESARQIEKFIFQDWAMIGFEILFNKISIVKELISQGNKLIVGMPNCCALLSSFATQLELLIFWELIKTRMSLASSSKNTLLCLSIESLWIMSINTWPISWKTKETVFKKSTVISLSFVV